MASLGDLMVRVGANIDGFERAMGTVGQRLRAIDRDVNRTFSGFDKIGDKLTTIGSNLSVGVTLPLAAVGAAATKMAADFDLGLRKVGSLVGGFTDQEMKRLTEQTLAVSRALGIDAVKATDALYEAISAGVPKDNAVDFLAVASKAAIAGVTETKVAVDGLTSIINAYGMKTSDAKEISDAMFQAVNIGKFQFDQLASSIAIATPLASSLGVGFKEVLAAGATLTSQGMSISEALTSVRSAMTAMISPNKQMKELLAATGYETGQALIQAKGFQGALETLREAAHGNVTTLTDAYGRVEALGAGLKLTGESAAKARADLDSVKNSSQGLGAATLAYNEINKSSTRQFEMAVTAIKATAIELGIALLPAINNLLRSSQPLIQMLTDAVKWLTTLDPTIQAAALGAVAFVAAIGPVAVVGGTVVSSIGTLGAAFSSLGVGMLNLATGQSIKGLTGAFQYLAAEIAPGMTNATALGEAALTKFGQAAAIAAAAFVVWEGLKDIAANAKLVHEELDGVYEIVGSVGKSLISLYAMALKPVTDALGLSVDLLKPAVKWFEKLDLSALSASKRLHAVSLPLGVANDLLKELHKWLQLVNGKTHETIDTQEAMRKAMGSSATAMRKQADEATLIKQRTSQSDAAVKAFEQSIKKSSSALAEHTIKSRHAKDELKLFGDGVPGAIIDEYERRLKAARKAVADSTIEHSLATQAGKDWSSQVWDNIEAAQTLSDSLFRTAKITMPEYIAGIGNIKEAAKGLVPELKRAAEAGVYEFGTAAGIIAMHGHDIRNSNKKAVDESVKDWKDFGKDVSTVFTNFAQSIAKSLFDGDLSFGEKAKTMLKSLGEAVVAKFIEPATKAIGNFISGVLSDLLSGKGFGGVLEHLKGIGESIGKIFTGVSSGAGAVNTATGSTGSAGGAAGAAVGQGIAGVVTAIASVGTLISSVFGNFQNARQETTLNAIEESTRYVKIWTGEQSQSILWCNQKQTEYQGYMVSTLDAIGRFASESLGWLQRIGAVAESQQMAAISNIVSEGGIAINIYDPTFNSRDDIDYLIERIGQRMRETGQQV